MPWFRFIDDARRTLRFRNGTCELWLANLGGGEGWAWVAEKAGDPASRVVLVRHCHMPTLKETLTGSGFQVEADGPAEKVMRAAERCGFAEELPENEQWRRELIAARSRDPRRTNGRT